MKQEILKTIVTFTMSENFTLLKAKSPFVSFVGMTMKENASRRKLKLMSTYNVY